MTILTTLIITAMAAYIYSTLHCLRIPTAFVIPFISADEFLHSGMRTLKDLGFSDLRLESEISNRSRIKI